MVLFAYPSNLMSLYKNSRSSKKRKGLIWLVFLNISSEDWARIESEGRFSVILAAIVDPY